ncbi:MAG TPA: HK97 gp10 family phage protein [Micromonospora sp.]
MTDAIRVEGLSKFARALRKVDADAPKGLRIALNTGAQVVVDAAKARVPRRSGQAAGSLKARSTRTAVRVSGGGARVPYYPWLDFGGRVGRSRSVRRPFLREGRYLYRAYFDNQDRLADTLAKALTDVVRNAGLEED